MEVIKAFRRLKDEMEIFYAPDKWNRRNMPSMFCKYCQHNEKRHGDKICFKCRELKEKSGTHLYSCLYIPTHKFNESPTGLIEELQKLIPKGIFQDDHYYMGLLINYGIDLDKLREIELIFNWKLKSVEVSDKHLWIIFYKTRIFCTYCGRPAFTMQEKIEHEQSDNTIGRCYAKPKEVTFATE